MINLQKAEKNKNVGQPGILTFASPAITPSNTFKAGLNQLQQQRDRDNAAINSSSQIHGRKCDSPQLRVIRDEPSGLGATSVNFYSNNNTQRPQTVSNSAHLPPNQIRKDDYLSLYNYHNQIRELNHTNKEIQKKQFDFNLPNNNFSGGSGNYNPKHKANVTISYDSNAHDIIGNINPLAHQSAHHQHRHSQINHSNYPNEPNHHSNNNTTKLQHHNHKPSRSIGATQKRRQQSQQIQRHHQPSASIVNSNLAQPLINLHIQNAKLAPNQGKAQLNQSVGASSIPQKSHKRQNAVGGIASIGGQVQTGVASNSQIPQKFSSLHSGQQSAPAKSRSKSKNRQKSLNSHAPTNNINSMMNYNSQLPPGTQQRANFMAQATKEILNQSSHMSNNFNRKMNKNSFLFSFDNKENESINYNEFSPSRIIKQQRPGVKVNNFLDSDSSEEENSQVRSKELAHKLEKQYFLDKSTLLKHLSPDRNLQNSKTRINKQTAANGLVGSSNAFNNLILSDRDNKAIGLNGIFSNGSTIMHNLNESGINKTANQSLINIKFKKLLNSNANNNNKILLKGVDKLIKENLRKNKSKEEEEISKRYLEEFKQKLRKNELTQRNQQVRKINASKIFQNIQQHKNLQAASKLNISRVKKQRSKSCMNKTDNIFGGIHPRSKERLPQTKQDQNQIPPHLQQQHVNNIHNQQMNLNNQNEQQKREKKREKSFVLEIKELQKQIDGEIRREIMQGKIDIQPTSAANKRTNLSTINAKRDPFPYQQNNKQRKDVKQNQLINAKKSSDELLSDNNLNQPKIKSKSRDNKNKSISQNIKKFMEKKKNVQQQMKSLEQTIENKKHQKIKENLKSLNQFAKQHFRHQSYNFYPKKRQEFSSNVQLVQNESGKALPIKKLKPHFFSKKGTKKRSTERPSKRDGGPNFRGINAHIDEGGNTIFDDEERMRNDRSISPEEQQILKYDPNGDVSQEFFEDYQKLLNSIQKHQKQKVRDPSSSYERSTSQKAKRAKSSSSNKKGKKSKIPIVQSKLQQELEVSSALIDKRLLDANRDNKTFSIDHESKFSTMRNDNGYVPSVVQEKGASLIPPQSDIATLERTQNRGIGNSHGDASGPHHMEQRQRYSDVRRSHDSGKSPKLSEQKAKIKSLMNRYGHNLPKSQINAPSADTKLLIKLHSAAITIQQKYRTYLQGKGFYDNEYQQDLDSSEPQSQMYLDSEEEQQQNTQKYQYLDTTEKKAKNPPSQLIAQTSPLRVKTKYQQKYISNQSNLNNSNLLSNQVAQIHRKLQPQMLQQQKGTKFYSEDSSDIEKVVVCSVITSGRADNDESLSNTQKYVPLRQKIQLPTGNLLPPQQTQQQMQQKQYIQPSSTSSATSQLNTVIKNQQPIPLKQRLQIDAQYQQQLDQQSLDQSQLSSSSQRKRVVPSLDFGKLTTIQSQKEETKQNQYQPPKILHPSHHHPLQDNEEIKSDQQQPGSNTARSLFDRSTFKDFQQKIKDHGSEMFNMNNYPEMLNVREEAIKFREVEDQKHLQKLVRTQQMSPRTYDREVRNLEIWVTKEKEEVRKTRKNFEDQWKKTANIIEQTQKSQEKMKRLFNDGTSAPHANLHGANPISQQAQVQKTYESLPSENTLNHPITSHRLSTRREDSTRLLDMIDDYKQQKQEKDDPYVSQQQQKEHQDQVHRQQQQQKDQERLQQELERKKEIELLKEQERVREQERQQRLREEELKRQKDEEQQRKIKEEKDRIEKQRLIQLEKDRLKREEEERQLKKQQEEEKRQRDINEKRKRQEEEDRKVREAEEKRRKDQEIERKRVQDERNRKLQQEEDERQRIQKLKLAEDQEKQRQAEQKRQRELKEEQDRLRKEQERQRKLQEQRDKEEQEEKKRQDDLIRKQKEERDRLELQRQVELQRQQLEEQEQIKQRQQEQEEKELKNQAQNVEKQLSDSSLEEFKQRFEKKNINNKMSNEDEGFDDEEEDDPFMQHRDRQIIDQAIRGKDIIDSFEDDRDYSRSHQNTLLDQAIRHSHSSDDKDDFLGQSNQKSNLSGGNVVDMIKEEESRQLARTTSSQNLDHRSLEGYTNYHDVEDQASEEDDQHQQHFFRQGGLLLATSGVNYPSTSKLNDDSMDEDKLALQLLDRQDKQNIALAEMVKQENFFSQAFDDQKPDDLLSNLQKTLEQSNLANDITQDTRTNPNVTDKILFQDEADEENKAQDFIEPSFNNSRLSHEMRNQIPVEQEEVNPHGLPVSPASGDGQDIRITTGAQSLESTISDGEQIRNAITEANQIVSSPSDQNQADDSSAPPQEQSELDTQADQITDDIFRQLMAEMRVDLDLLLLTDPRRLLREEAPANQNQFLSESGRFLIFERRGIKTDLFAIERYVEEVLDEILKDQPRFQQSISTPISKNAREVLNQLQNSEIGSYEHFEPNYPVVLPLDLYLRLERRRKETRERELQETQTQLTQQQIQDRNFLAECEHIHNKVLFDCINDSLLQFKPYGKDGVPLPWSRQNRRLKPIEEFSTEEMFEIVKHDLFRWAIMQAGTLPRREFVFNNLFDDELFAEIREKKLATLLAREMIENEPKWLNYEFEEAQVKIDIGDMILEQLVTETITILRKNEALHSAASSVTDNSNL